MLGTSHDSVAQPVVPFTYERMAPNRTQGERADARKGRARSCAHACVRLSALTRTRADAREHRHA